MSSGTPHVLMGHALYKLQDKVNKTPRGFAFVKMDPSFDNLEGGFDYLPVRSDITTAMNGDQVEMIRLIAEVINKEESVKHELGVVEADLNLSVASSTNDSTLDECRSVTSFLSPIMLPVKYQEDVGFASIQSTAYISQVESNGNEKDPVIKLKDHDNPEYKEEKKRKLEDAFSPVVSLAAGVVSEIKAKERRGERGLAVKKDVMHKRSYLEHDEADGCFGSRNAKEVLSEDDFNKLSKPFALGWKRECVTQDDNLISDIYYITPPHENVQGKRLRKPSSVAKYLSEERNESNLKLENFSFKRVFMGFEPQHELVRLAIKSVPPGENQKYDNFFEIVAEDRYRCLLCGNIIRSKGNSAKAKHVKGVHEPDVKCEKCGKDVRALHIQSHETKCSAVFKVMNDNEMFCPAKRKASKDSEKYTKRIQRLTKLSSPISPVQEIVDMKSSQPLCEGSSRSSDRSPIVEESVGADTKIDQPVPDQHTPKYTEKKMESFNAQHGEIKIQPRDQHVPKEVASEIDSKKSCSTPMVTLEMSSVEGFKIKMQVKVHYKLVKVMKKFGVRMGVSYQELRFILDGKELTGEELAEGLDGAQILVERRVS